MDVVDVVDAVDVVDGTLGCWDVGRRDVGSRTKTLDFGRWMLDV